MENCDFATQPDMPQVMYSKLKASPRGDRKSLFQAGMVFMLH
jgi:hypothetical protein